VSGYGAFRFTVLLVYLCELIKGIMGLADRRAHASSIVRVFGCVVEAKSGFSAW